MNKKNLVIAGIDGWIASEVAMHFISRGYVVKGIGRRNPATRTLAGRSVSTYINLESQTRDLSSISAEDHIFLNFMNLYVRDPSSDVKSEMRNSNALAMINLLEQTNSASSMVNFCSLWQHGNSHTYYAQTKNFFVDYLKLRHDIASISLYIPDVVGESDKRNKVLSQMVQHQVKRLPLRLRGGSQLIELLHISELIVAIQMVLEMDLKTGYREFQVLGERILSLSELADIVASVNGISEHRFFEFEGDLSSLDRKAEWRFAEPLFQSKFGPSEIVSLMLATAKNQLEMNYNDDD